MDREREVPAGGALHAPVRAGGRGCCNPRHRRRGGAGGHPRHRGALEVSGEAQMTLEEHLAVPYVLRMESVAGPGGEWLRRAAYPELPGCVAEGASPLEA